MQNSNLISCNNCISCCDKTKLRSAKAIQYRDKLTVIVLHDINNRTRVYSAQCACLLVDIYKKINKVHFFRLVPRPISTVKEGDWVVVIYEEKKFIGKVVNVVNRQAAVQCLTKPLGESTPQDLEADTVYHETVYYTSIMPKLVKLGRGWKWSY